MDQKEQGAMAETEQRFRQFVSRELTEITHPFSYTSPSYRFNDINTTTDVFLFALKAPLSDPAFEALYDHFLTGFDSHENAPAGDFNARVSALTVLAIRFEAYVKKVACLLGHPSEIVDRSPWKIIGPTALGIVNADLYLDDRTYWESQAAGDAVVFRTRWIRNQLAHEAKKLVRRELDNLFLDIISAFLYVTEQLSALPSVLIPAPQQATDWPVPALRPYCEYLLHKHRFTAWEQGFVELDVTKTLAPGSEFRPYDLLLSVVSRMSSKARGIILEDTDEDSEEDQIQPATEVVRSTERLLLCGPPGAGKTTILRYCTLRDAQRLLNQGSGLVPVYVELGAYRNGLKELIDIATPCMSEQVRGHLLRCDDVAFYLDGLNEVDRTRLSECVREIRMLLEKNPAHRVIITTRPSTFYDYFDIPAFLVEELLDSRIRSFASRYLGSSAETFMEQLTPIYRELARTPLMLMLLIRVFYEDGALPDNRGLLYQQFVKWFHQREHLRNPQYDIIGTQSVLEHVAFRIQEAGVVTALESDFYVWMRDFPGLDVKLLSIHSTLAQLIEAGWLLQTESGFRFWHQTFQEFLAAEYIVRNPGQLTDMLVADDTWQDVLLFLVGILGYKDDLLTRLSTWGASPKVIAAAISSRPGGITEQEAWALGLPVQERIEFMQELRGRTEISLTRLVEATLTELDPSAEQEARKLGAVLRYRERTDEWKAVTRAFRTAESREYARAIALVLGNGHAPLIRELVTRSLVNFRRFWAGLHWTASRATINAINQFILSDGLEGLDTSEKVRARYLFLSLLRSKPRLISPVQSREQKKRARVNTNSVWKMAVRGLERIGTKEDLELAVSCIDSLGNSTAAQAIRVMLKHRPKGLQQELELILRTKKKYQVTRTAVEGSLILLGGAAEPILEEFIALDPERNNRIVADARRRVGR